MKQLSLNKKLDIDLKTGNELFTYLNQSIEYRLIDFWKWSASDLVSNTTRGRLAEFIVAMTLGVDIKIVRDEWQAYDLITPEGIKVEVKSASYIQSWYQKDYSIISFSIKKSLLWDSETNIQSKEACRPSDVYVFALLKHKEKDTINPMILEQWGFYVVSTEVINNYKRSEHSITLKSLQKLTDEIGFEQIKEEVLKKIDSVKRFNTVTKNIPR